MAIGKKTGGRDFEPGKSGNPNGRPRVSEELKQLRAANRAWAEQLMHDIFEMTQEEVEAKLRSKKTKGLERILLKIWKHGEQKGDDKRLQFLMDRAIGPIVQKTETEVNVKGEMSLHEQIVKAIKDNEK